MTSKSATGIRRPAVTLGRCRASLITPECVGVCSGLSHRDSLRAGYSVQRTTTPLGINVSFWSTLLNQVIRRSFA